MVDDIIFAAATESSAPPSGSFTDRANRPSCVSFPIHAQESEGARDVLRALRRHGITDAEVVAADVRITPDGYVLIGGEFLRWDDEERLVFAAFRHIPLDPLVALHSAVIPDVLRWKQNLLESECGRWLMERHCIDRHTIINSYLGLDTDASPPWLTLPVWRQPRILIAPIHDRLWRLPIKDPRNVEVMVAVAKERSREVWDETP